MDFQEVKRSILLEKSITLLRFLEKSITMDLVFGKEVGIAEKSVSVFRFLEKSINMDLAFRKEGGIAEKSLSPNGVLGQWKEGRLGHFCFSELDFSSFNLIMSLI